MAGIYIHIPFCKKACHYCNFYFSTSLKNYNWVVDAILQEIEMRQNYLPTQIIETIYFGGGTPSLLKPHDLDRILNTIYKRYKVNQPEITLETNPDDITVPQLLAWKALGVNRLSIGVQSFFNDDLLWMNRAHNGQEAEGCIKKAQDVGFSNLTADLIYGLPHGHWEQNIDQMVALNIPHISCYALMVEEKTALSHMVKTKQVSLPKDEAVEAEYHLLCKKLKAANYQHYEISNFAQNGYTSKHNAAYWQSVPYLGLGPSAHSYNGTKRRWNLANNSLYLKNMQAGLPYWEDESLTEKDRFNEYLMTSLRTAKGASWRFLQSHFNGKLLENLTQNIQLPMQMERLALNKNYLQIPEKAWFMADTIIADLFEIE